jgi:hypothetical protein
MLQEAVEGPLSSSKGPCLQPCKLAVQRRPAQLPSTLNVEHSPFRAYLHRCRKPRRLFVPQRCGGSCTVLERARVHTWGWCRARGWGGRWVGKQVGGVRQAGGGCMRVNVGRREGKRTSRQASRHVGAGRGR